MLVFPAKKLLYTVAENEGSEDNAKAAVHESDAIITIFDKGVSDIIIELEDKHQSCCDLELC